MMFLTLVVLLVTLVIFEVLQGKGVTINKYYVNKDNIPTCKTVEIKKKD